MSKRSQLKQLTRILHCSRREAQAFSNEVNQILARHRHRTASLKEIAATLKQHNSYNPTPQAIALLLASIDQISEPIENTSLPERRPSVLPEVTLPLPKSNVLDSILATVPTQVTYRQIEESMTVCGLNPQTHEDEYLWLIEQFEAQNILVVDQLLRDQDTLAKLEEEVKADAEEVHQILREIFGNYDENHDLLTPEEQRRLLEIVHIARQAKTKLAVAPTERIKAELQQQITDGEQAFETLMVRNRRLVASVALKYGRYANHLEFDDLFQEGIIGLHKAIERFDLDFKMQLSTYATWWIRQAITRSIADQDRTIRLPVHRMESIYQYRKAVNDLDSELMRQPTDIEIAERLNKLSPRFVAELKRVANNKVTLTEEMSTIVAEAVAYVKLMEQLANLHPLSLDQPTKADADLLLGDLIPDPNGDSTEATVFSLLLKAEIERIFGTISTRECLVLTKRFGLDGDGEHTLEQVGAMLNGVTRERIRQIEARALRKIRHPLRSRGLIEFFDGPIKEYEDEY
ncbi:MAG: sigma-70 family RNA polymerase sigma factor [Caldilineaceae bacterium]